MDVFSLVASLTLDSSEYESALVKAKASMKSLSDDLTTSFSSNKLEKVFDGFKKGFEEIESVGKKAGSVMQGVLGGFATAATAVAGFGASAVSAGMAFDEAMSQVSAVSGATGADFDSLRNKALEMGAKTQFSASEAAEAMNYMAMAGWKTQDMLGGISGIMNLAAASGEDLATTSDIVTDALTAFGMSAADSGHFADILAAASSNANTNVSMLGESFKYAAPVAGALGFSAEDVSLALGLMANSGIKASQAGTSLRASLTNLANPTKAMGEMMVQLGLATEETVTILDSDKIAKAQNKVENKTLDLQKAQVKYNESVAKYGENSTQAQTAALNLAKAQNNLEDAYTDLEKAQRGEVETAGYSNNLLVDSAGNVKSLREVLVTLREKFADLTQEEQAQAAATLFGKEAMSGMLAIINASDEDFNKLTKAIDSSSQTFVKTIDGAIIPMSQAIAEGKEWIEEYTGAAESMSKVMMDNLAGDVKLLKSALESLQIAISDGLTPTLREFAKFGQEALASLLEGFQSGGVSGLMAALKETVTNAVTFLSEQAPKFADVSLQFMLALASGILDARDSIISSAKDIIDMLIDGIDKWMKSNEKALLELGEDILSLIFNGFVSGGQLIAKYIGDFVPLIAKAFLSYHEALLTVGLDILGAIGQGIIDNIGEIKKIASGFIERVVTSLKNNAPMIIEGGLALLMTLIDAIMENLPLILEVGVDIILQLVNGLAKAAPDLIVAAIEAVLMFAEALTNPQAIANLVESALYIIEALIEGIVRAIPLLIEYGPEIIISLVTGIIAGLPRIIEVGVALVEGLIKGLIEGIVAIPAAVVKVVTAIIDAFKALFGIHSPSTVMAEMGAFLIAGLLQGISENWQSIVDFFAGAAQALIDFLGNAWESIKQSASAAWDGIKQSLSDAWETVKAVWNGAPEFFSGIWEGIKNIFSTAKEILSEFFAGALAAIKGDWGTAKEYFSGVWNDIKAVFSSVKETLSGFFREAWESIKATWQSAKEYFANIAAGIKETFNDAKEAIGAAFKSAADAARNAWDGAKEFFAGIWQSIKDTCSNAVNGIKEAFANTATAIKGSWDGVKEFFANIWSSIKGTFKDALSHFSGIGQNIVDGIKKGISGAWTSLTSYVTGRFKALVDSVKSKLGIASPSKVFASIGRFMAEGLGVGWEDEFADIQRMITDGLNFIATPISVNSTYSSAGDAGRGAQTGFAGVGDTVVNIYSPVAIDAVQAAREWRKTTQRMALAY